ncbi:hypothetical protein ABZX90_16940 [Streptomyces sp. NPDC002935]|uniref:hypothetical protein n=1 Tax=Streptomyces sp. NPDC002935 TaxID=3154545 RepID=UPI0033B50DC5
MAVGPDDQPELWARVRAAAEVAGQRPPDELYLDAEANAGVASARNFIRPKIFDGLAGMVHLHLAQAGHATPDIAWSGRPRLALPEEWEKGMDDALDAAVADTCDTAPLRSLLASSDSVRA